MSHADELSLENEAVTNRLVKQESATPRAIEDAGDTTADESTSRKPRDSIKDAASPRRPAKRKRRDSPERAPAAPPFKVLWTRNFPKISISALESISGHRYAGTFSAPVKERDAPGYKDLILRPQDLKSIRSAITAGNKAAAAAAAADDNGQSSMLLSISEDLVPPKGIINSAQLEKELMRIFANAIMFNADPDRGFGRAFDNSVPEEETAGAENYEVDENGVVRETRAMFADVEKIVSNLRAAERRSEREINSELVEDEVDELAGDGESAGGSLAKRRKRA